MFEGIITAEFKQIFKDAINALLEDTALTVPCQLIYAGTKWTDCPNCLFSPATNKSTGIYTVGGPIPFYTGICPYCNGEGRISEEDTETIYLAVIWDYRKWVKMPTNIKSPEGYVQTLSTSSTITKLKKAKELHINTDLDQYVHHKFERDGEPGPIGLGEDAFLVTMWRKI